eukprot:1027857-Prorocentrum_lima.AAC.1
MKAPKTVGAEVFRHASCADLPRRYQALSRQSLHETGSVAFAVPKLLRLRTPLALFWDKSLFLGASKEKPREDEAGG